MGRLRQVMLRVLDDLAFMIGAFAGDSRFPIRAKSLYEVLLDDGVGGTPDLSSAVRVSLQTSSRHDTGWKPGAWPPTFAKCQDSLVSIIYDDHRKNVDKKVWPCLALALPEVSMNFFQVHTVALQAAFEAQRIDNGRSLVSQDIKVHIVIVWDQTFVAHSA